LEPEKTLGQTVDWFPDVGPYNFRRAEYKRCFGVFKREFKTGDPLWGLFLSPTVYKSRAHLGFDPHELHAMLEPESGRYFFPPAADPDGILAHKFPVIALQKDVGDVEVGVWTLRKAALQALSATSISVKMLGRSFRRIETAAIPQLRREIQVLRNHGEERGDPAMLRFVAAMEELAEAALTEGNPICV